MINDNEVKKKTLGVVEKVVRHGVMINMYGWPPKCSGWLHQPKRPKQINK